MLNFLFPKICAACSEILGEGENILCVPCRHQIPMANLQNLDNDILKNKFYGRFPVVHATALFQFQKRGMTQNLLHKLKYKGREELSYFFGEWLGADLRSNPDYSEIDMVIPVPLHKQRLRKRGYNQVEGFGKELAKSLQIPYRDDILLKVSKTTSQVIKNRLLRFESEAIFSNQKPEDVSGKHILLVDDIITTGATLEKCALQLLGSDNVKISIATIAITY